MKNVLTIELIRPVFKLFCSRQERDDHIRMLATNIATQIIAQEEQRFNEEIAKQWNIVNGQIEKIENKANRNYGQRGRNKQDDT